MLARWLTAVIAVASITPAHAGPAEDAQALAGRGDFLAAAAKYREAFRAEPRADHMCNVGVAYYKAKDLPRAHRYLDQCLAIGGSLDPAFITSVKKVLAAVEQTLAQDKFQPVNLVVQPAIASTTIDGGVHDEPLVGSRRVWLPYGTYRATVRAAGYTEKVLELTIADRRPSDHSITLEPASTTVTTPATDLPPRPESPTATSTDTTAITADNASLAVTATAAPERPNLLAPVVASAATGVLGGAALAYWVLARQSANSAGVADVRADYDELVDTTQTRRTVAWVAGGAAGIAAITAGVLWWRALRTKPRVEVTAGAGGGTVSLSGRW